MQHPDIMDTKRRAVSPMIAKEWYSILNIVEGDGRSLERETPGGRMDMSKHESGIMKQI